MNRRDFIKLIGGTSTAALAGCVGLPAALTEKRGPRVVVVGGGYGGTIAAKYVRLFDPSIEVVLVERNRQFISCPFSNHYIAGITHDMTALTLEYDRLASRHDIKLAHAEVIDIDPVGRQVITDGGAIPYDRLIVSPGIDFRTEEIEGYDARTAEAFPHAWKAGPQSTLLRNQLQAMPDGGTVLMSMPLAPYRCPPGPYERACLIAHYLKQHKPKSKLILLDANPDVVSKKPLFTKAWSTLYKDNFEYLGGKKVTQVDVAGKSLSVEGIEEFKADVINLIPPQRAANIVVKAGLAGDDRKWCPVDAVSFESLRHKDIHIIGDAAALPSEGPPMPKSGYAANSQAKFCAKNVVALLNGTPTMEFAGVNVCYSAIDDRRSVSIAQVFKLEQGKIKSSATAISPADFSMAQDEHQYAESWLRNILTEMSS